MTNTKTRLDVSIGPVQSFVAQSRRTRDLWGSSYLLAFLSAHAMRGAEVAGGKIVQPVVGEDPLYHWVIGGRNGNAPRIGSTPNHFVVVTDGDGKKIAESALRAFSDAWTKVCNAVWTTFVAHVAPAGSGTDGIWRRQVTAFWEVMWTVEMDAGHSEALTRRKYWRRWRLPDEPGDKCTVMNDLQELSGCVRPQSAESRKQQDAFWARMREQLGPLDMRDNERLCAIALVKRLFPKVSAEALGWRVDTSHWPSTVYVAAVPWIRDVISAAPQPAGSYALAVRNSVSEGVLAERRPPFIGLDKQGAGDFPKLDASYFHREFVKTERLCPLAAEAHGARDELDRRLRSLYDTRDEAGRRLGSPPSFYALLLADGDHLGRLVRDLDGETVGNALTAFTHDVPKIVQEHDGVTVYAGGDDVLAMLSAPRALSCAATLSESYRARFPNEPRATCSAAVVFAHARVPLGAVLTQAHRLLHEVAKDSNGRNSLAAGILKPGGLHCEWTTAWEREHPSGGSPCGATMLLEELVSNLKRGAADSPGLSTGLIYRIRETLAVLCERSQWKPGAWAALPSGLDVRAFLHAEILRSLSLNSAREPEIQADTLAGLVWSLLGRSRAGNIGSGSTIVEAGVDALLLARFLSAPHQEETVA